MELHDEPRGCLWHHQSSTNLSRVNGATVALSSQDNPSGGAAMLVFHSPHYRRGALAKLKHYYGPCEAELARYVHQLADRGDASALLPLCERRLENVVCRAGFTRTRIDARRAVVHGHVLVNRRKMTHPGYLVQCGDAIGIRPRPHIEAQYRLQFARTTPPRWLRAEPGQLRATVLRLPVGDDVRLAVDSAEIVEVLSTH
jgi:small subunit ribosomal protein S4